MDPIQIRCSLDEVRVRAPFFSIGIFLIGTCCQAQQPVAPTVEPVGPNRGDNWHDYNIVNSFETGYRFVTISGNTETYRSNVNYQDGVRLLSSFFSIDSKDGHGPLFDEVLLTTNGLGGDPYQSATVRVQKNRLYQYDLLWRSNNYVNPGLVTDGGAGVHFLNTTNTFQDDNLTLFPQSAIRFLLGYSRSTQDGPGISTVLLFQPSGQFNPTGDIFSPFANIKRVQNEYRLGGELHWHGLTLNVLHGWQDFKDDTQYQFNGFSPGDIPNNSTSLTSFFRTGPYHGTSPYWRVGLFGNSRLVSINARFTYTAGARNFISNETAVGINQLGAAANQQIITFGDGRRPVGTGNVTVSLFPTSKLTVVNQTSIYNVRTDGDSTYLQFDNATKSAESIYFQYLGIRTVATQTDLRYELNKWLDLHGGYEYANRKIASNSQFALAGTPLALPYYQTNELNSGSFGFQVRPLKRLTITADDEIGRATRPFTPKGDKNYNVLVGRAVYKMKKLELSASTRADYNQNSVTLSSYSSHARIYSASASWAPQSWLGLDATFSKSHLDTLGGIAFFASSQFFPNQVSYYVSNIYAGTLFARLSFKRADLYIGYSRIQDTGDGRPTATTTIVGPNIPAFQTAQTFPLKFQSPSARLSFRISERLRWNVGYQYYGYHESFSAGENYIANTGYTSILWSF
jgi:hypothetical protein